VDERIWGGGDSQLSVRCLFRSMGISASHVSTGTLGGGGNVICSTVRLKLAMHTLPVKIAY
jgi:hypothetical protein